jgi:CheY-like chemotaxis protein
MRLQTKDEQMNSISVTKKRVLLVDDEEAVVTTGQEMIERYLDYKVTALTNSVEALEAFRAKPDHFDLVITDMIMPKMTGEVFAKELLAIRPDTPIILCTSYSEEIVKKRAEEIGGAFLVKPFDLYELGKAIRKVLNKS